MFLRNYDVINLAQQMFRISESFNEGAFEDGSIRLKNMGGSLTNFYLGETGSSYVSYFLAKDNPPWEFSSGRTSLILGKGNTKETYDDYKLENIVTSDDVSYSLNSLIYSKDYDEDNNTMIITFSRLYTAKKDFELGEVGLTAFPHGTSSSWGAVLIYRKAFEKKIPILKDQNFKVTVTQKIITNPNNPIRKETEISVD